MLYSSSNDAQKWYLEEATQHIITVHNYHDDAILETVKKGDKDVTYLYCDCDPQYKGLENPFFEDRSFGFLIVDGKWLVIIELNAGYTGKPFEHKVMEWLDFETIKFTNP